MAALIDRLDARARRALLFLLAALLFYVSVDVSDAWMPPGSVVPALWLASGIGYGIVTVGGRIFLAPVALAALLEAVAEDGYDLWHSLLFAGGTTLATAVTVELIFRAGRRDGERAGDTLVRFAAGVPGAAIGATALQLERGAAFGSSWTHAAAAHFAGFVIAGPLLRTWLRPGPRGVASPAESVAMVVAAAGLAEVAASGRAGGTLTLAYLMFPPLIWAALRTGRRGVATAALVMSAVAATNLAHGHGLFVDSNADASVSLDVFLVVLTATGLLLTGLESARREGQATLRRSEERFRAMIEHATDLVTVLARDGTILYEGPAVERILGWRADELTGGNVLEWIHPDDRDEMLGLAAEVAGGGDVFAEVRFRRKDGTWAELRGQARDLSATPGIGGILVNSRDVSRSVRAERALESVERRYRALVEQLPLVTYVNGETPDSPPRFVSPQMEDLLGYPLARWYEEPRFVQTIMHPDDAELVARLIAQEGEQDLVRAEYRLHAADGRVVWVLDHMVTIRDDAGEPVAVQGFLVDITERKRLEEELRRAQRMEALGLLAGGVAHDFNNLLTAISGYGELARASVGRDPERVRADLEEVLHAAERASALTRQLLAFGRRQPSEPVILGLNALVDGTRQLLERLVDANARIECVLDPAAGSVLADPAQLEQVLLNLVVNARDAMPGGGRITISTGREGDDALLAVADTGVGIPDELRERLFEPFFTTKEVGKGTGLGLAVVYGIVEECGGRIDVRSEPGRGSEFRILLPASEEPAEQVQAPANGSERGSGTVLLVEDEDVVRRLTARMLESQGYRVLERRTPAEALEVAQPYDLLLTDVVMPGMSGPALAQRLRSVRPVPVLFMSGYAADAVADREGLPGALLEKPFTLEQLAEAVRAALAGPADAAAGAAL